MDILDSIMSKMDKPPSINNKEKKLQKERQKAMDEARAKEREVLKIFRKKIEDEINAFIQDGTQMKNIFSPMDTIGRSIVRDVSDVAGLTTHVFGLEEEDRYAMVFKKEYPLSDEELNSYRSGHGDWDPVKSREEAQQREAQRQSDVSRAAHLRRQKGPTKFLEKYERLVGKEIGVESATLLQAEDERQFGFVRSELKKDKRTIEETLADIRAKKMKRSDPEEASTT